MKLALSMCPALVAMLALGIACAGQDDDLSGAPPAPDASQSLDAGATDGSDDDAEDAALPGRPRCSPDGFCYVPVPVREPLVAVSASSVDDAWMLPQQSNKLLRWDGTTLKVAFEYASPSPQVIVFGGIWAEKKDNLWAVANDSDGHLFIVRHSSRVAGQPPAFRELKTDTPATEMTMALWGAPDGDALWIVTDWGVVRVHEDERGAVVEDMNPTTGPGDTNLYSWHSIWGFSPDDVYVAGRVCVDRFGVCAEGTIQGAIGHYDGEKWSMAAVGSMTDVMAIRGTPPGGDRQLWYVGNEVKNFIDVSRTNLVTAFAGADLGKPLFSHPMDAAPACSSRFGQATSTTSGWFSDGLLLCRWTGTTFEPVLTSLANVPVIYGVNGIWASGTDDVWVVGASLSRSSAPDAPFAARRVAKEVTP
ncbi:MAG: Type fimbrial biosis protein PilY1 [Labilithrix sp.]|nr:Type fimbrial biosis protein PilY1 [Labilithrix sp.]